MAQNRCLGEESLELSERVFLRLSLAKGNVLSDKEYQRFSNPSVL